MAAISASPKIPFNWNAHLDVRKLRVGYLEGAFEETRDAAIKKSEEQTLDQMKGARPQAGAGETAGVEHRHVEYRCGVGRVLRRPDPLQPR